MTTKIPLEKIVPNPEQPRKEFDIPDLIILGESIKEHGLINPISVEECDGGLFILIDGERRVRASRLVGLSYIEASIRSSMDGKGQKERLLLAMIANLQRADINPLEEAQAFQKMRELGMSTNEIGKQVGMSASNVFTRLKMLELEPGIQTLFAERKLPLHSQVIAAVKGLPEEIRLKLAYGFATRATPIHSILSACKKVTNNRWYGSGEKLESQSAPASQLACRHSDNHANLGHWNAFAQAKVAPAWPKITEAVEFTCKKCPLSDIAGESTCKDCGLVDFLKYLMEDHRVSG